MQVWKPAITDLELFCRIVELGSLRAAAEENGADPSSVTRRLLALEEHLGARLITRSRVRSTVSTSPRRTLTLRPSSMLAATSASLAPFARQRRITSSAICWRRPTSAELVSLSMMMSFTVAMPNRVIA